MPGELADGVRGLAKRFGGQVTAVDRAVYWLARWSRRGATYGCSARTAVRTVLVPAALIAIGNRIWWPGPRPVDAEPVGPGWHGNSSRHARRPGGPRAGPAAGETLRACAGPGERSCAGPGDGRDGVQRRAQPIMSQRSLTGLSFQCSPGPAPRKAGSCRRPGRRRRILTRAAPNARPKASPPPGAPTGAD